MSNHDPQNSSSGVNTRIVGVLKTRTAREYFSRTAVTISHEPDSASCRRTQASEVAQKQDAVQRDARRARQRRFPRRTLGRSRARLRRDPAGGDHHVGQTEERVELMAVFRQPAIPRLPVPKQILHDVEGMFDERGATTASNCAHGIASSLRSRNRSRRVLFFFAANSAWAKVVWFVMPPLSSPRASRPPAPTRLNQRFLR